MRIEFAPQLAILLVIRPIFCDEPTPEQAYLAQWPNADRSAVKTCMVLQGTMGYLDPGNEDKGYFCQFKTKVWTGDDEMAMDYCESTVPFTIMSAATVDDGGTHSTECKFRITVNCRNSYQIYGKCYLNTEKTMGYEEAKKFCEEKYGDATVKAQLALFYSDTFRHFLHHMDFSDAWVNVDDIKAHFVNATDRAAVIVMSGAYKYDVKPGTLILDDLYSKHLALCEYDPGMSKPEMYRIVDIYRQIYPMDVVGDQVLVSSASYSAIESVGVDTFKDTPIVDSCKAIGLSLGVPSFPIGVGLYMVNQYKSALTHNRFYLSNAIKTQNSCSASAYTQNIYDLKGLNSTSRIDMEDSNQPVCNAFSYVLNKERGFAAPAAMRGPALCTLFATTAVYASCPDGWFPFERSGNRKFCHLGFTRDNVDWLNFTNAEIHCRSLGAELTGFETEEELFAVIDKFDVKTRWCYIGASRPCEQNCIYTDKFGQQKTYVAGWRGTVSDDNHFVNNFPPFSEGLRSGTVEIENRQFAAYVWEVSNWELQHICGRYASVTRQ